MLASVHRLQVPQPPVPRQDACSAGREPEQRQAEPVRLGPTMALQDRKGELAAAFNSLSDRLQEALHEMQTTAEQVASNVRAAEWEQEDFASKVTEYEVNRGFERA